MSELRDSNDDFFDLFLEKYEDLHSRSFEEDKEEILINCWSLNKVLEKLLGRRFCNELHSVDARFITMFLTSELEQNRLVAVEYESPSRDFSHCLMAIGDYPHVYILWLAPDGLIKIEKNTPQGLADHLGEVAAGFREDPAHGEVDEELDFHLISWQREKLSCGTILDYLRPDNFESPIPVKSFP